MPLTGIRVIFRSIRDVGGINPSEVVIARAQFSVPPPLETAPKLFNKELKLLRKHASKLFLLEYIIWKYAGISDR